MALKTMLESDYDNWELSFVDDSSDQHSDEILEIFFEENPQYKDKKDRVKIFKTNDSIEEKKERGEAIFGLVANDSMRESDAEITLMLCDDDGVIHDYLSKLNSYYLNNPERIHSYSKVIPYNPLKGRKTEAKKGEWVEGNSGLEYKEFSFMPENYLNCRGDSPHAENSLDSSQVSWRRSKAIEDEVLFPYPKTSNLDAVIYNKMDKKWGECHFNGIIGQYKAFWEGQNAYRQDAEVEKRFNQVDLSAQELEECGRSKTKTLKNGETI